MDHWFDSFTKELAASTPSRRTFVGTIAAVLGVSAIAQPVRAALAAATRQPLAIPMNRSITFGPCTLATTPTQVERLFSGSTTAAGHNVAYRRTHIHAFDPRRGTTLETTILIDGRPVLDISSTSTKTSTHYRLRITDAFGIKEAELTSDDGKTMRGTVDGRALRPYVEGRDTKLTFADGKPFNVHPQNDVRDAVSAAFAQADKDLALCVAPAPAPQVNGRSTRHNGRGGEREVAVLSGSVPAPSPIGSTQYFHNKSGTYVNWAGPFSCGVPMYAMTGNAQFNPKCVACGNRCTSKSNSCEAKAWGKCIGCLFSFGSSGTCGGCYDMLVGCTNNDYNCLGKCNVTPACFGQLCQNWSSPAASLSPYVTCRRGDVCVSEFAIGQGGYCCPHRFPVPCGLGLGTGSGAPGSDQTLLNENLSNNFCCPPDSVCLQLATYGGSYCQNGNHLVQCCPKQLVCGKVEKNGAKGYCCPPGTICYDNNSCCNPLKLCHSIAPYETAPKPGAPAICCENLCNHGLCCQGKWCGDKCCAGDDQCGPGGRCIQLCLSGVRTIDGRCCHTGSACGTKCCVSGCQDPKTSTCRPAHCPKGLWKCTATIANSNATEIVCCPKGRQCYNGQCCEPGKVVCQNRLRNYAWGCWPQSDCIAAPK